MSSPLAIAAVTAVLQKFLQNSVAKYGLDGILNGTVKVSAEAPDRIENGAASPDRINLFLFQATENQGWRNNDLPTRDANGDRGSMQDEFKVYGRDGEACRRCHATITKTRVGGRGTWFCPRCQPL